MHLNSNLLLLHRYLIFKEALLVLNRASSASDPLFRKKRARPLYPSARVDMHAYDSSSMTDDRCQGAIKPGFSTSIYCPECVAADAVAITDTYKTRERAGGQSRTQVAEF